MLEREVIELNTLLEKYKEHLCIINKNRNYQHQCCENCREAEYNEGMGQFVCGVDNFAENFREEFDDDVDFSQKEE